MKKTFMLWIALILCAFALTSCGYKPESAKELMGKIDEQMEALDSYQMDMTANLSTVISGVECKATLSGQNIVIGEKSGEYYYYLLNEGTTEMKSAGIEKTVHLKSIEAFCEGNMFVFSQRDHKPVQKLYSALSKEDYIAYLEKQNEGEDIDFEDCVNASFEKNSDQTWTVTYSGYTKKTADRFAEIFAEGMFEAEVSDMEITVYANKDFTVKEVVIKLIFDEADSSAFNMNVRFSKYNEATAVTDTLNPADYTKINDCRVLKDIEDMIEDAENEEQGSWRMEMTQTVKVGSQKQEYKETDMGIYGKKNGKYHYTVAVFTDSQTVELAYEQGKQRITIQGMAPQTVDQTEEEAKQFINGLLDPGNYQAMNVSSFMAIGGMYKITCDNPDVSAYESVFASMGASIREAKQSYTFIVKDGKITNITMILDVVGSAESGGSSVDVTLQLHTITTLAA